MGTTINPFIFQIESQIFRVWSAKENNLKTIKLPDLLAEQLYKTHRDLYLKRITKLKIKNNIVFAQAYRKILLQKEVLIKQKDIEIYLSHYDKERLNEELFDRAGKAPYPYIYFKKANKLGFVTKWIDPFSLLIRNKRRTHLFQWNSIPSLSKLEPVLMAVDKHKWSMFLESAGFPVVKSIQTTVKELLENKIKIQYPIVIKPSQGTVYTNVFCDIKDEDTLKYVLKYLSQKKNDSFTSFSDSLLVQPFVDGDVMRWCFFTDDPTDIIVYEWPKVVGDGVKTISELTSERTNFWNIEHNKIFLTELLKQQNLNWESVLDKNQTILLNKTGAPGSGGASHTLSLKKANKGTAIVKSAMKYIGLKYGTIEAIVPKTKSHSYQWNKMQIIDINPGSVPDVKDHEKFLKWIMNAKSAKPLKTIEGDRHMNYKKKLFVGIDPHKLK